MRELSSTSLYNLTSVNRELFLAEQGFTKVSIIEARINETRQKLLDLMRELEAAKAQPAIQPISLEVLEHFFATHPAMRIQIENGIISLISENQCVAFHTLRGRNNVARNNDIIYVTLPLYGFRLDFHPDGCVSGKAIKSETIREVAGEGVRIFGHPHATCAGLTFQSICNGNNRFIQDWQDIMHANSLSGPILMRLMSQAAVWMETANLSDMYGTFLAENVPYPNVPLHAYEAFRLYISQDAVGAPSFLKDIFRLCGINTYKRCLYSIWLFRKYRQLSEKAYFKDALYKAIATDLLVMQSGQFLDFVRDWFDKELQRTNETAIRCLDELGGYRPRNDNRTMSELYPEIFHMEDNYA